MVISISVLDFSKIQSYISSVLFLFLILYRTPTSILLTNLRISLNTELGDDVLLFS